MNSNMGKVDRIIRIIIGIILLFSASYIAFVLNIIWLSVLLGIIGAVMVITSLTGVCLLYVPFNISTKEKK